MVTLTMSPDSSCELDHLTVRDRDGKRMNVIMESDTKYSFTMHGSEAEIEATFSKIEEPPKQTSPILPPTPTIRTPCFGRWDRVLPPALMHHLQPQQHLHSRTDRHLPLSGYG